VSDELTVATFAPNPALPSLWRDSDIAGRLTFVHDGWTVTARLEIDQDGWESIADQEWENERQRAAARQRYEDGDYEVFGVVVEVAREGVTLGDAACWGIDVYTGSEREREQAGVHVDSWLAELLPDAIHEAESTLGRLCASRQRA
jgi:hypothetical protein